MFTHLGNNLTQAIVTVHERYNYCVVKQKNSHRRVLFACQWLRVIKLSNELDSV